MSHSIALDYRAAGFVREDRRVTTRAHNHVSSAPAWFLGALMAVLAPSCSQFQQVSAEYVAAPGEPIASTPASVSRILAYGNR